MRNSLIGAGNFQTFPPKIIFSHMAKRSEVLYELTRLCDATEGQRTELFGSYIGFNSGLRISAWFRYDLKSEICKNFINRKEKLATFSSIQKYLKIAQPSPQRHCHCFKFSCYTLAFVITKKGAWKWEKQKWPTVQCLSIDYTAQLLRKLCSYDNPTRHGLYRAHLTYNRPATIATLIYRVRIGL